MSEKNLEVLDCLNENGRENSVSAAPLAQFKDSNQSSSSTTNKTGNNSVAVEDS